MDADIPLEIVLDAGGLRIEIIYWCWIYIETGSEALKIKPRIFSRLCRSPPINILRFQLWPRWQCCA